VKASNIKDLYFGFLTGTCHPEGRRFLRTGWGGRYSFLSIDRRATFSTIFSGIFSLNKKRQPLEEIKSYSVL
jgi:hypothetical protein